MDWILLVKECVDKIVKLETLFFLEGLDKFVVSLFYVFGGKWAGFLITFCSVLANQPTVQCV